MNNLDKYSRKWYNRDLLTLTLEHRQCIYMMKHRIIDRKIMRQESNRRKI